MFRMCAPVLAAMALAIAGCGGDDSASPAGTAEQRLSKEQYIAQADAICAETADEQQAVEDSIADIRLGNVRKELASVFRRQLNKTRAGFRRVKKLRPPEADQAQVAEWLDVVEQVMDRYGALVTALRTNKLTGFVRASRERGRLDGEQEILADLLGLVNCRNLV